jgi:hypothetical protein
VKCRSQRVRAAYERALLSVMVSGVRMKVPSLYLSLVIDEQVFLKARYETKNTFYAEKATSQSFESLH